MLTRGNAFSLAMTSKRQRGRTPFKIVREECAISGHSAILMVTLASRPKRTKRIIESNGKISEAVGGLISFSTVNAHIFAL
jgi:hypothetical protein